MAEAGPAAPSVRPLTGDDRPWVERFLRERWGSDRAVSRGVVHRPAELPGFVAELDGERVGLATFAIGVDACELVTIDAAREDAGVGSALLDAVAGAARRAGCRRVWLITTNDNARAQRWYERRGFVRVAVHAGAVDRARELKPEIPLVGAGGVPIRDELEYERRL